jgi:hypothetical protein
MRVTIRFIDGEIMEGTSEAATLSRMGFPVLLAGGNNAVAWVSLASIKYVLFRDSLHDTADADPRDSQGLTKIVLHFVDGEILRSYKDDTFSQDGEGFTLRLWDPEQKGLIRVIVSLHALKAIFFVNQWDSRSEAEKVTFAAPYGALQSSVPPPPPRPPEGS